MLALPCALTERQLVFHAVTFMLKMYKNILSRYILSLQFEFKDLKYYILKMK